MFESGDTVWLLIGELSFQRTVLEVRGGAVFLVEGGDAFNNETGIVWGGGSKKIVAR